MHKEVILLINDLDCYSIYYNFFFCAGGGVMGASGWNAALTVLADFKH